MGTEPRGRPGQLIQRAVKLTRRTKASLAWCAGLQVSQVLMTRRLPGLYRERAVEGHLQRVERGCGR